MLVQIRFKFFTKFLYTEPLCIGSGTIFKLGSYMFSTRYNIPILPPVIVRISGTGATFTTSWVTGAVRSWKGIPFVGTGSSTAFLRRRLSAEYNAFFGMPLRRHHSSSFTWEIQTVFSILFVLLVRILWYAFRYIHTVQMLLYPKCTPKKIIPLFTFNNYWMPQFLYASSV